jgi:30S ribosomal protein S31
MGKGDRRSKRGKIWRGTNGKARPKKKKTAEEQAAKR